MTSERWPLYYLLLIFCLSILSSQNAEAKSGRRRLVRVHANLAHSICTEKDEFERTDVLQKPIKRLKDFDVGSLPCGWFPLKPCQDGASPPCVTLKTTFLPCDKGHGQPKTGRRIKMGKSVKPMTNNQQGQEPEVSGLGLKPVLESNFGYIPDLPGERGRSGNMTAKRLPLTVTPQNYDLFVRPVITEGEKWPQYTAPGTVTILLDVHESTDKISLHRGKDLEIISAKLTQKSDNTEVEITGQSFEEAEEIHTFELASSLTPGEGQYEIFIEYKTTIFVGFPDENGIIPNLMGITVRKNNRPDGTFKIVAVTQLQYDWARRVYPAFDEPRFKATYTISIARTADFNSLSNSLLAKTEEDPENPGWFIDSFEPTLKMSPYLVAFAVSDFTCAAADPSIYPSKPVQICGDPGDLAEGLHELALNTSAHGMKVIEEMLKFPYEHSKIDGIAAPLVNGGMENWGLALYGDNAIYHKQRVKTEARRLAIIELILHEIAHMWVGNLVTCKSWHYLWLNEGLTVYVQGLVLPQLHPEVSSNYFQYEIVQDNLSFDVNGDSVVTGPTAIYSSTIYKKGSSIMRMVEGFMGKELLLEALAEYFKRFAYKAVENDDFFAVLDEFAVKEGRISPWTSVKEILVTWLEQPGYPLVRVERDSSDPELIKVTQKRFKRVGDSEEPEIYVIPIYIASHKNPTMDGRVPDLWLSTPETDTKLEVEPDSWYIFNADGFGVYFVLYSDELFDLLLTQLSKDHTAINVASRTTVIFDYFHLHSHGHVKVETALSLTKYLINELEPDVWQTLFRGFSDASKLKKHPEFREYWIPRIQKLLDTYSIEDLGELGTSLEFKAKLLQWSNSLMLPAFTAKASAIVEEWKSSGEPTSSVRADYWQPIYCGAVADKDASQFDFLLQVYKEKSEKLDEKEIIAIFGALTCSQDPEVIQKFLDATIDEGLIKEPVKSRSFYKTVTQNAVARGPLLKFLKDRFDDLIKIENEVEAFVLYFSRTCYSEAERDELLSILEENQGQLEDPASMIEDVNRNVESNFKFMTTTGDVALKWFAENK